MQASMRQGGVSLRLALVSMAIAAAMLVPGVTSAASRNLDVRTYSQLGNNFCGGPASAGPQL